MKKLKREFTKKGITYSFVEDGENFRIYTGSLNGQTWYEVFQKRINSERMIAGELIEASEAYPFDEAFGKWAWTASSLEMARKQGETIKAHKSTTDERPIQRGGR